MGPDFLGQLFALRTDTDSFEPLENPVAFHSDPLLAGYINGGTTAVMFIGKGEPATVILRAWNASAGPDWETASSNPTCILGQSNPITITLGGRHLELPAYLTDLQPFELTLAPEPATIALFLLGLATVGSLRRRL